MDRSPTGAVDQPQVRQAARHSAMVGRAWRRAVAAGIGLLAALSSSALGAEEASDAFAHSQAVLDSELAELRGGFLTSDGLEIRFGLEQIVLINGTIEARTSVNLSSLTAILHAEDQRTAELKSPAVLDPGGTTLAEATVAPRALSSSS